MTDGNGLHSFLLHAVPETNPKPWIFVNNTIAISGCFLLVDYWYAMDYGTSTEERPFATGFYIVWEFVICLLWVAESSLSACYQHLSLQQSLQWYTKLELLVAVYFTITTTWMLYQWNINSYDANEIWSIVLDVSFYIYLAIRSCLYQGNTDQEGNQGESTLDDEGGDGLYERMEISNNDDSQSGTLV
mmetsp:Transcript_11015/g.17042  ORF Transcript_11015/g.17042 Transcript_11015/m.17042 type:complete len:188 (-) Transcript_11015:151-714(-)